LPAPDQFTGESRRVNDPPQPCPLLELGPQKRLIFAVIQAQFTRKYLGRGNA
jgi:hypothetical protein